MGDVGRIYIADLAAYNDGYLKGAWIEPAGDEGTLMAQIEEVLTSVKRKGHPVGEEWAIHDYDGFPDMGEYPGVKSVAAMAEALESVDADALKALLHDDPSYWGKDIDAAVSHVEDNLAGIFKDASRELVDEWIDEGLIDEKTMLQYIDAESFGRDVRMDLDEEGEDNWAAELSDEELGEHYIEDGVADKKTLVNYFDGDRYFRELEMGDINVIRYDGQDFVFWNR
jgi:antirestriction protein